jgi:hypothetical protein
VFGGSIAVFCVCVVVALQYFVCVVVALQCFVCMVVALQYFVCVVVALQYSPNLRRMKAGGKIYIRPVIIFVIVS